LPTNKLPEPWHSVFEERKDAIRTRLEDFAQIPASEYFYELAFCMLTPQSSAINAERTILELKANDFINRGFDPTSYLRDPGHYIRFHNVKAKRLRAIRDSFPELLPHLIDSTLSAEQKRDIVLLMVKGLGMKETAHFLRNIGVRDLAILDRHILKHLHRLHVIKKIPASLTRKRYQEIEKQWKRFAERVDISIDELDLLFWSMETGEIRK
jgi:N-glycosylase/DNA lyase